MSGIGVLDKVMAILRLVGRHDRALEPRAVADELGYTVPTTYRLMKGMAAHGLLEHEGGGRYRLGVTLLHLGARVADDLEIRRVARPHMEWLRDQTHENAELHLRHGSTRVPVDVVPSRSNLRPIGQVGVPLPIHVGASAKVLLSWLEADEVAALVDSSRRTYDEQEAPFDLPALLEELEEVRLRGWAHSDAEREAGVASVAAPVRDRFGVVTAAMTLSAPSSRLSVSGVVEAAAGHTVEAAARTSHDLGLVGG